MNAQDNIYKINKSDSCSTKEFSVFLSFYNDMSPLFYQDLIEKACTAKIVKVLENPRYPCSDAQGDYSNICKTSDLFNWAILKGFNIEEKSENKLTQPQDTIDMSYSKKASKKLDTRVFKTYKNIVSSLEDIIRSNELLEWGNEFYNNFFHGIQENNENTFLFKIYMLVTMLTTRLPSTGALAFSSQNDLIGHIIISPDAKVSESTLQNYFANANNIFKNIFTIEPTP